MSEKRWTDGIADSQLQCMLTNICMVSSRNYWKLPLWGFLTCALGIGSTHAHELCSRAGIFPDKTVKDIKDRKP